MKSLPSLAAFLLVALIGSVAVTVARAADPVPNLAVVDVGKIMRESSAAKDMRKQMQSHLQDFRKWGKSQEDQFRGESEQLRKQQSVLAQDTFQQRQTALQKKVGAFQVEVRKREQAIRQAGANAQQELEKMLVSVVSEVAKKEDVNLVLPKESLLYAAGNTKDITDETLKLLNKKLPSIKLSIPK